MNISSFFADFLYNIRLTAAQKEDLITGHQTLRDRLHADPNLSSIIIETFLQGSYRRFTAVRAVNEKRADVDVIVVTNIDRNKLTPQAAIYLFKNFVKKYYNGKYEMQGRSIGIKLSYVDLDIVITSAPSESDKMMYKSESIKSNLSLENFSAAYPWKLNKSWTEPNLSKAANSLSESIKNTPEWKMEPLWIPDREAGHWVQTHPLEQIRWTQEKNKNTNGHYVNVVKALKWFRHIRLSDLKYPKGYPLEHMIGDCCQDGINSVPEGVCVTLENIILKYNANRITTTVPTLPDRGVSTHDVWKRITPDEFVKFYDQIKKYAVIAREAQNAQTIEKQVEKWQELFGSKFPDAPKDLDSKGGFTERTAPSIIGGGRFA